MLPGKLFILLSVGAVGLQVLPDDQGIDAQWTQLAQFKTQLRTSTIPEAPAKLITEARNATTERDLVMQEGMEGMAKADSTVSIPPNGNSATEDVVQIKHHIAWLISGQVTRFIYMDGMSMLDDGISGFLGCGGLPKERCPGTLDMHIVLSDTEAQQFSGPEYVRPYYMRSLKTLQAEMFYSNLGADNVRIRLIPGDQFEANISDVRKKVLDAAVTASGKTKEEWETFWSKIWKHKFRFETNGNMMYLRHLAYASALEFERTAPYKYTHVLYTRDDNVFVHPAYTLLGLARQLDGGAGVGSGGAAVFVDSHCGFDAWSDKIYFANRGGIDVLFPRTMSEHIDYMVRWINVQGENGLRLQRMNTTRSAARAGYTSVLAFDPLQTEAYFKTLLINASAAVTEWNFNRTEARYTVNQDRVPYGAKPVLCIPEGYANCTDSHEFPTCA